MHGDEHVGPGGTRIMVSARVNSYVQWSDLDSLPRKVNVAVVPTTGADATVTHNLGTDDLIAVFRDSNTDESVVPVSWAPIGSNTITVTFETAPTTGQYRAIVIG